MEVLIADDDPLAVELLKDALTRNGYEVFTCNDGHEAITTLRKKNKCQLVISDWEMPGINGIELCKTIRSNEFGRYVYILLLTCKEGTSNVIEGLSAGADDFMTKPFEPSELFVRLRSARRVLSLETRNMTIFALAKLAESRDQDTGEHLERVRDYSKILSEYLAEKKVYDDQIEGAFIELMYLTSPLHDIGKVAIPDYVLLKPGRLDEHEFEIMKSHSTEGAATLNSALQRHPEAKFLHMARDIAAYHHERYDGNGYVEGLAGEDIPLCARIFSVADVYDALISKRVYKEALNHEVAKNIIIEGEGAQFDAKVVNAFFHLEEEFRSIAAMGRSV